MSTGLLVNVCAITVYRAAPRATRFGQRAAGILGAVACGHMDGLHQCRALDAGDDCGRSRADPVRRLRSGLVAIVLTAKTEGTGGVRALLRRIAIADVPVRLYIFALTYIAAVKVTAAVLHRVVAGAWPPFGGEPLASIPFAIALSTPFQAGEEIGWRGFALPRLADRYGLRIASVVLGMIWALWHLPQFYIAGADTYHHSFVVWAPQVVAMSIAFAWLYARSGGSLLLVMLLHSAINNSKDIVRSGAAVPPGVLSLNVALMAWLVLGLLWVAAAWCLARMPRDLRLRDIARA